jgi:hypothetical protein
VLTFSSGRLRCGLTPTCTTLQVDIEALNAQVEEKKQRKAAEQEIEQ